MWGNARMRSVCVCVSRSPQKGWGGRFATRPSVTASAAVVCMQIDTHASVAQFQVSLCGGLARAAVLLSLCFFDLLRHMM